MSVKKKIFLGWLALEIAAIPFAIPTAAHILQNSGTSLPRAASVDIPSQPGLARILVASDGAFTVLAQGAQGPMRVSLHTAGKVNGNIFGARAHHPGAAQTCSQTTSKQPHALYTSSRSTAPNIGPVIEQAIVIEIAYDVKLSPVFTVETLQSGLAKTALETRACSV